MARLLADKTATAGMVAKLRACEDALDGGVDDVVIVDGRDGAALAGQLEKRRRLVRHVVTGKTI